MVGVKCECGNMTIRKWCWYCGKEQEGSYFKCYICGEHTLEGYESETDMRICCFCPTIDMESD